MSDSDADVTYRGPDVPTALGEQLQVALGLDERPETLGDWIEAMASVADRDGVEVDVNALCTTDESPHRATVDGRVRYYRCVQDPIVLPFLADDVDAVTVETESPAGGDPIELTVTETEIQSEPPDVVLSLGVAADVEEPPSNVPSPILAYERFCPYVNAFHSRAEYEEWAGDVTAVTMPITVTDAFEVARAFGRVVG